MKTSPRHPRRLAPVALAVEFTEKGVRGYILLNGHRFVIADATYINAPVGVTMTDMDNSGAKVVLLDYVIRYL